jgi:hypothetical protein
MTRWYEHRAKLERVGSALSILKYERVKLGLGEIDAEAVRRLAVEAGIAARAITCNVNRLARSERLAARATLGLHCHAPERMSARKKERVPLSWRMPQRTFKGTCALCGASVDKRRSAAHYTACAPAHDVPTGREADLLIVRLGAVGAAEYWRAFDPVTGNVGRE